MNTPNPNLVERLLCGAPSTESWHELAARTNQERREAAARIEQLEARIAAQPLAEQPQGNAADQEEAKALSALQDRLDLIYRLCCGTAPKQSVGELVAVMQKMPEWETVSAALATRAADPALIPDTPTTRFMLAEALQADPVTVQPAHNFSDWGYCTTCGRHTDTVQAIGMSCNGAAQVSGMPTQPASDERELFEKWFSSVCTASLDRMPDGDYAVGQVYGAWRVWQARAALQGAKK